MDLIYERFISTIKHLRLLTYLQNGVTIPENIGEFKHVKAHLKYYTIR